MSYQWPFCLLFISDILLFVPLSQHSEINSIAKPKVHYHIREKMYHFRFVVEV